MTFITNNLQGFFISWVANFLINCLGQRLSLLRLFQEKFYSNSNAIYSLGYAIIIW